MATFAIMPEDIGTDHNFAFREATRNFMYPSLDRERVTVLFEQRKMGDWRLNRAVEELLPLVETLKKEPQSNTILAAERLVGTILREIKPKMSKKQPMRASMRILGSTRKR